uniref:Trafficking protein particle complex subunit 6B n=3 Tax=Macrostomum lignano TaxID=282301 RepID=A0A1I8F2C2_9PLAT
LQAATADSGIPAAGAEVAFQFLHSELVSFLLREQLQGGGGGPATVQQCRAQLSKLETMGFRVGQAYVEKMTKDLPRFRDDLEIVKFLCKDFWASLFKKQVDNLKTNHQGVYVVIDEKFSLLVPMARGKQYLDRCHLYTAFPCGLIRGALTNLGLRAIVTAEVEELPRVKFQIQLVQHSA